MPSRQVQSSGAPITCDTHLRELLTHTNRHRSRLVESLRHIPTHRFGSAHRRRRQSPRDAQRSERYRHRALPARPRCVRTHAKSSRVGDNALLNSGFQSARKREAADGEHRVTELQHPGEKMRRCPALRQRHSRWSFAEPAVPGDDSPELGSRMGVAVHRRTSVYASRLGLDMRHGSHACASAPDLRRRRKAGVIHAERGRERLPGRVRSRSGCLRSDASS